ncbi:hypothetical protein [Leeia sp.]|uniref:hypothetical protein n=1 Tax=Leeia sp. TaxID=2884678 RepID=UPI0035B2451B
MFKQALLLLAISPMAWAAEPLTITYIEKPPYYYTDERGLPAGFLLQRVRQALSKGGLSAIYVARPARRALEEIRVNAYPVCSIGWFMNDERRGFARFSHPLHRDQPIVFASLPEHVAHWRGITRVSELLTRPAPPRIGVVDGFVYGAPLDALLQGMGADVDRSSDVLQALRKLQFQRVELVPLNPEELDYYQHVLRVSPQANAPKVALARLTFSDMPPGNLRYLMCSKQVPDAVMTQLDSALPPLSAQ